MLFSDSSCKKKISSNVNNLPAEGKCTAPPPLVVSSGIIFHLHHFDCLTRLKYLLPMIAQSAFIARIIHNFVYNQIAIKRFTLTHLTVNFISGQKKEDFLQISHLQLSKKWNKQM